jgi:hypothetical protein
VFSDLPVPLLSAWASGDGVLYAVGGSAARSLVLRHDRDGWWEMDPGTRETLWWVFGFSSTHVYAVGASGTVVHFNGQFWEVRNGRAGYTLYGIWGASPSDLLAVGGFPSLSAARPVALRYQGGRWRELETGIKAGANLFKVFGTSAENVLVSGDNGILARFDGSRFRQETSPTTDRLVTVFGSGPEDLYAVGGLRGPVMVRFDGRRWSELVPRRGLSRNLNGGARTGGAARGHTVLVGWSGFLAEGDGEDLEEIPPITRDCLHAVAPIEGGFVAVGGDLFGAQARGVLLARGELAAGPIKRWPAAGRPLPDSPDAGVPDAGPDAGPDAATLLPGEYCDSNPNGCGPLDECWLLIGPNRAICSRSCGDAGHCGAFGRGACCLLPGPQVTIPVCEPAGAGGCPSPDAGVPDGG